MSTSEWLADIGKAADELGYGILGLRPGTIELIQAQDDVRIDIESVHLSGELLRRCLVPIPHRSGWGYTRAYEESQPR